MLIGFMIFAVVVVFVFNAFYDKSVRVSDLQKVATELGFDFNEKPNILEGREILNNSTIYEGRSDPSRFEELMSGVRGGYLCYLVRFHTSHGREGDMQTIICVDFKVQKFPPFAIVKELPFGWKELPSSKKYVTQSTLKNKLIKYMVITDRTASDGIYLPEMFFEFFVNFQNYCCEYSSGRLFFYRPCVVISPDKVVQCLDNAIHLAAVLDGIQS